MYHTRRVTARRIEAALAELRGEEADAAGGGKLEARRDGLIAALQVLDNSGSGGMAGIESALRWVIDNAAAYNIVAVNMSLGGGDNVSATRTNGALGDEFAALNALGVITTVAAGNDFFTHQTAGVSSIAADPNALAVGAVWSGDFGRVDFGSGAKDFTTGADRVTSFSQRSASMGEIFAPGAMITGAGKRAPKPRSQR